MENNQLQLVTFEQAVKLGKTGFDWSVSHAYVHRGMWKAIKIADIDYREKVFQAPTVALALKWMRDVKNIVCGIHVRDDRAHGDAPYVGVYEWGDNESFYAGGGAKHTYESAESALLDELLNMIDK